MNYNEAKELLEKNNQSHLLEYFDELNDDQKAHLLEQISEIDFDGQDMSNARLSGLKSNCTL